MEQAGTGESVPWSLRVNCTCFQDIINEALYKELSVGGGAQKVVVSPNSPNRLAKPANWCRGTCFSYVSQYYKRRPMPT